MIFAILGLGHHHIVHLLLRMRRVWWVVAYVVGRVLLIYFHSDVCSVQFAIFYLASLVRKCRCACWHSILHECIVIFDVYFRDTVSPYIDVFDRVLA